MGVNKNKVRVALKSVVKTTRQGTCWPAEFFFSVFFPRVLNLISQSPNPYRELGHALLRLLAETSFSLKEKNAPSGGVICEKAGGVSFLSGASSSPSHWRLPSQHVL